jgi:hypothetical protein
MRIKGGHVQEIVNRMTIKDRIQRVYASAARERAALTKFKREHGYCGGSPSCLNKTGEEFLCSTCRHNAANPRSNRSLMEYGRIRMGERKAERESKSKERARTPNRRVA